MEEVKQTPQIIETPAPPQKLKTFENESELTIHEKESIEVDVLKELNNRNNIEEDFKKKTKKELVDEFIKMQEAGGKILYTETALKRLTKAELLKKIGVYASQKIENFTDIPIDSFDGMMALSLYQMNMSIVKLLETTGHVLKDYTKGVNIVKDLDKDVEERKEAFLVIFKQIYIENKEVITSYMTSTAQYFMLMSACLTTTIAKNAVKKKED